MLTPTTQPTSRHLDLTLSPYHGESPQIQPYARSTDGPHVVWARTEAEKAEKRLQQALRAKINAIADQATRADWQLVESLTINPRPEALLAIVQVLDHVQPSLLSLEILGSMFRTFEGAWEPTTPQTLDFKLLGARLTFPVLTHLRITANGVSFSRSVLLWLDMAPNLVNLDVDFSVRERMNEFQEDERPSYPSLNGPTKLSAVRCLFGGRHVDEDGSTCEAYATVLEILRNSPLVERLTLSLWFTEEQTAEDLLAEIGAKESLRDFHWPQLDAFTLICHIQSDPDRTPFQHLQRLVIRNDAESPFWNLPALPNLERMYCHAPYADLMPASPSTPLPPTEAQSMLPRISATLIHSPRLRSIHPLPQAQRSDELSSSTIFPQLDELERANQLHGYITSMTHGDDEVLCARFLTDMVQTGDINATSPDPSSPSTYTVSYTTLDDELRKRVYQRRPEATWQIFTDDCGEIVPLETIKEMREMEMDEWEEMKNADWDERGVVLHDYAWATLTGDWSFQDEMEEEPNPFGCGCERCGKRYDECWG